MNNYNRRAADSVQGSMLIVGKSLGWFNHRHLGFNGRRGGNRLNTYVDYYDTKLCIAAVVIIIASSLDAFLTLNLLSLGAVELNILMAQMIETDTQLFVNYKLALTGLSLILMVVHKNFCVVGAYRVEQLIYLFSGGYLALICYEVGLMAIYA